VERGSLTIDLLNSQTVFTAAAYNKIQRSCLFTQGPLVLSKKHHCRRL